MRMEYGVCILSFVVNVLGYEVISFLLYLLLSLLLPALIMRTVNGLSTIKT